MIIGSPNRERPDQDDEPARVTSDDDGDDAPSDDATEESFGQRLLDAARTLSEVIAPFTGLLTSIVHAITAYQFLRKA
jgi:hypothetical protein